MIKIIIAIGSYSIVSLVIAARCKNAQVKQLASQELFPPNNRVFSDRLTDPKGFAALVKDATGFEIIERIRTRRYRATSLSTRSSVGVIFCSIFSTCISGAGISAMSSTLWNVIPHLELQRTAIVSEPIQSVIFQRFTTWFSCPEPLCKLLHSQDKYCFEL